MVERTVIKIPGKNTRDQTKAAKAARQALNRSRGRPLKLVRKEASSLIPPPVAKAPKKRSLKNIKSKKKMSQLERLPTELLETVFLYCLNMDLPRASPIIGARLNSETVYMRTILFAFGSQWSAHYSEELSLEPEFDLLANSFGDEADLQSSILRCRWATVEVLLRGKHLWDQRTAAARLNKPAYWLFNRYAGDAEPQDLDNPAVEELSINSNTGMDYTLLPPKNAMESFEDAFSMFSSTVTDRDFSLYKFTRYRAHYNCLAKGVELPHSILRGPWTEETIQYLFWIMVAGGELNWTTSTTGEIALRGFKDAVMGGNLRVAWLLQEMGIWAKSDLDLLVWMVQNVGGDKYTKYTMLYAPLERAYAHGMLDAAGKFKIMRAVAHERDRAERTQDQETLDFLETLEESGLIG